MHFSLSNAHVKIASRSAKWYGQVELNRSYNHERLEDLDGRKQKEEEGEEEKKCQRKIRSKCYGLLILVIFKGGN